MKKTIEARSKFYNAAAEIGIRLNLGHTIYESPTNEQREFRDYGEE